MSSNTKVGSSVSLTQHKYNKTGLQPVSRPVERLLGFFPKGFNAKNGAKRCSKNIYSLFLPHFDGEMKNKAKKNKLHDKG